MRVRMKVSISGTRDGADWPGKDGEVDLPDEEATQLIRNGAAEAVAVGSVVETATVPDDTETAAPVRRRAQGKK
ncbi:hypothetical protein [Streptomyces sp. CC208A]|uniref:hypothetical protein n=1 Tax=Streptomyces sp. CC208A TaxID=3044573 RepID=UPI0024A891B3|nr:hypothetical protein [Streptomyces sp. CC208A]